MSQTNSVSNNVNLKHIDLSNMPNVKIEEAPSVRSQGRRFRVIINGVASDKMILKKILKQINKISKIDNSLPVEEKLAQLKSVKELLVELKNADTAANVNYDLQGKWYKFRTWWHRLFVSGNNEKMITKLENKLDDGIQVSELEIKIYQDVLKAQEEQRKALRDAAALNQPLGLNDKPIDVFLQKNLTVFQACVKDQLRMTRHPLIMKVNGYDVNITEFDTISFKTGNKEYRVEFNKGKLLNPIPEEIIPILQKTFELVITQASSYKYCINVVQNSLAEFPVWHLNEISKLQIKPMLEADNNFVIQRYLTIHFLDDDLKQQEGTDSGGLIRAYVSTLVDSIQDQRSLFHEGTDGLKFPRITRTTSNSPTILNCTKEEEEVYYNLGMLLRCGYNSDKITTGVCFSDILFNTALSWNYADLQTPFTALNRETHIQLARVLVQELPTDPEGTEKENMLIALDLCNKDKLDQCLNQTDQKAALKALSTAALVGMNDDGMEAFLDEDFLNANIDEIKENRDGFIDQLYQSIFSSKHFITELNGASLGQILSPIHTMARGMAVNSKTFWDVIKFKGYQEFNLKVQGGLDRKSLHDAIVCLDNSINRETNWLKEWIMNDASNDDMKNFLRFISGSSSMPKGQIIKVQLGFGMYPIGHSCFYKIDLPQINNKETFIERLKEAILVPDFGIS